MIERRGLLRFAVLSVAAAVVTICLKTLAYVVTGSIGLLSDAGTTERAQLTTGWRDALVRRWWIVLAGLAVSALTSAI